MTQLVRRHRPPASLRIPAGHEWWADDARKLQKRIERECLRGAVATVTPYRYELAPGVHGVVVRRLKPRPPRWRKPVLILSLVGGAVAVAGTVAYLLAQVPMWMYGVAAGVVLLPLCAPVLFGHSLGCPGIGHCPGCRG